MVITLTRLVIMGGITKCIHSCPYRLNELHCHCLCLTVCSVNPSEVPLLSSVAKGDLGPVLSWWDVRGAGVGGSVLAGESVRSSLVFNNSTFWKVGTAMNVVSGKGTLIGGVGSAGE